MIKKTSLLTLIFFTWTSSAHQLSHQVNNGQMETRHCGLSEGPFNFEESTIMDWWAQYEGADHTLVDPYRLPENLVEDTTVGEDLCSVYADPLFDWDSKTCGRVDHFMQSAQAAIQYCATVFNAVPVYYGPATFLQALSEPTLGEHHTDYDINEGIKFFCVRSCGMGVGDEVD